MVLKPITVARRDYMVALCEITNQSGLPAFVVVDILEKVLAEMRPAMEVELKNDIVNYQQAMEAEKKETEEGGKDDGANIEGDNG